MTRNHLILAVSWALASCAEPDDNRCDELGPLAPAGEPAVTLEPIGVSTFELGTESAVVGGSATHRLGLTVRRVVVAGIDAESTSFNFGSWSATIPAATIEALVPENATFPVNVTLGVDAFEPCSSEASRGSLTVRVEAATP